jgi:hypothetical protein
MIAEGSPTTCPASLMLQQTGRRANNEIKFAAQRHYFVPTG